MDVLKDRQYKSYPRLSRYSTFPYYYNTLDNKYVVSTTAYLDNTTTYSLYLIKEGDTLDSIALEQYNNPTYYWVLCSFNRIQDPFKELVVGEYIKVPVISTLQYEI